MSKNLSTKEVETRMLSLEKDNMGTRYDSMSAADGYWMAKLVGQKSEPYVIYVFDRETDAHNALLELDCIHEAADTNNLICTETLQFGYYGIEDGKYKAFMCGDDLTHELWTAANDSCTKHGGRLQSYKEPEKRDLKHPNTQKAKQGNVKFIREDRQQHIGHAMIYSIHEAPDAVSAKAFLKQNPVTEALYYLVVKTPEGNYCRDIQGIYKE